MKGTLFAIQRFSVHDGPGIRTTVFLKGCPLRCAWCQNPEGLSSCIALWNFDNLCTRCGDCVRVCPEKALSLGAAGRVEIDGGKCTRCGRCVDACVNNAMAFDGFAVEAEELVETLLADRVFFDSSGGGVTFSGGEPLAQHGFVLAVASRLREQGIHTAMETSMACSWETLRNAAGVIDHFLGDLKLADPRRHRAATGLDNQGIRDNFSRLYGLIGGAGRMKVRIPLIPGFTDDADNLQALGEFIGSHGSIPVELMNFNPLAGAKYRRMRRDSAWWSEARPFTPPEVAEKTALVMNQTTTNAISRGTYMDANTREFIESAQAGRPVFITDVRTRYAALPPEASFPLAVLVDTIEGGQREMRLRLPRFGSYEETGARFVLDFFLAEMYNILSSLGGRKITLINAEKAGEAGALAEAFNREFGVDKKRHERTGYGKCLNVVDRIVKALPDEKMNGGGKFSMEVKEQGTDAAAPATPAAFDVAGMFAASVRGLEGRTILGIDIGGTDIKLALAADGRLVRFKEFDWFPASFTRIEQLVDPVVVLVKLMSLAARAHREASAGLAEALEPAFSVKATVAEMERAIAAATAKLGETTPELDAIGMCFPDVVIDNKIVGGEVFKTRGIRDALGAAYDKDFAALTDLDGILAPYVKEGGCVAIVNDGPMAAFTAGVESAVKNPSSVADGVFAYTLGTELGTGWVDEHGAIPKIPLEVYNFIIDLGSWPERRFEPDDLRSINNFNTNLPGTLQKFACQSGVFRMALKYLPEKRPDLIEQMRKAGFVVESAGGLYVPTALKDMRKPFLEFMMEAVAKENEPELDRIFEEIGVALAVTGEEIDWILRPAARERILFGRLVKKAACFDLIQKGAASRESDTVLRAADDNMAETPLMKALSGHPEYTVAQFAQAVGAIYYGNLQVKAAGCACQ